MVMGDIASASIYHLNLIGGELEDFTKSETPIFYYKATLAHVDIMCSWPDMAIGVLQHSICPVPTKSPTSVGYEDRWLCFHLNIPLQSWKRGLRFDKEE